MTKQEIKNEIQNTELKLKRLNGERLIIFTNLMNSLAEIKDNSLYDRITNILLTLTKKDLEINLATADKRHLETKELIEGIFSNENKNN